MDNVIRLSKFVKNLGIVTTVLFLIIVLVTFVTGNMGVAICFMPFVFLGIALILAYKKQIIVVNEDEIVFSYLVKKTQHIKYNDIRCILMIPLNGRTDVILIDKMYNRLVTLEQVYVNYDILYDTLIKHEIDLVDFGELVEQNKDVSKYVPALNWIEKNFYKSICNENTTIKNMSKTIEKEILNESKLDSKYSVSNISYSREEVYVKGAQYKLDEVATIKALVDVSKIKNITSGENTLKNIPLVAYDSKGDKLDVEIVPSTIDATVTISSNSKEVPFTIIPEGDVKFGKSIEDITLNITKTTIYGTSKSLADITSIPVKVDVTDLEENSSITVNVSKPNGVKEMSVKAVVAKITLGSTQEKTVDNINIETRNLGEGLVAQAASAKDSSVAIILKGTSSNIENITQDNINAYVDLQGLKTGTHKVAVNVSGDNLKVQYKPKTTTITIIIKNK